MIAVGRVVEILPAYQCDTDARTGWDEIAGCEARIIAVHSHNDTVDVQIKNGDEFNVHVHRLKFPMPI
jgi:hypothetical protein